ncbi:MAG: hypothetical protein JW764_07890 [Chlorobiaceae bacterium]|nr:hypothetical protein [Chlorobiaceae bacterium]
MSERIETRYSRLFEVQMLHHYWLDDGMTVFDRLPSDQQERYLMAYDAGALLEVVPTAATEVSLKACRAVWRSTRRGFVVAVPDDALIPDGTVLEWMLRVVSPDFFNYTALTFRPQNVHDCFTEDKSARYRFKENVPVFSNLTGASRGSGLARTLFLSRETAPRASGDELEALFDLGGALCQLTADPPEGASTPPFQLLDADKTAMPVFASQRDVPEIEAPEGVTDAPAKGILLDNDLPDDLFALIRIAAVREDDSDFSIIDSEGHAPGRCPVFHLRFKNRHTWWKQIARDQSATFSEEPLPLTFFGNASGLGGKKPSAGAIKAEMDEEKRVSRLVSEIFN